MVTLFKDFFTKSIIVSLNSIAFKYFIIRNGVRDGFSFYSRSWTEKNKWVIIEVFLKNRAFDVT